MAAFATAILVALCGHVEAAYAKKRQRNNLPWQSESTQDQFLVEHVFRNRKGGFFIEAGAADGKHFSNTFALEVGMGWSGILIEPIADQARRCALNRPASACIQACVAGSEGMHDFLQNNNFLLGSGLLRYPENADTASSERIKVPCKTLSTVLKEHAAPVFIDWLSLDVEGAEMEVLRPLLTDGTFKIDVISIEAFAHQAIDKFNFMRAHGYQLLDRVGDDVYVLGWTSSESSCEGFSGSSWLRWKLTQRISDHFGGSHPFSRQLEQERAQTTRRLNQTERTMLDRFAAWAEKRQCKVGTLSFLVLKTMLSERSDVLSGICTGHGLMHEAALKRFVAPERYDDCTPFYSLPLSRMDFTLMLSSPWPCFLLLQLLSQQVAAIHPPPDQLCELTGGFPEPSRFLGYWPAALERESLMCGGLAMTLAYLDRAVALKQGSDFQLAIEAAERSLKMTAYRLQTLDLLIAIGNLPAHRSPWTILSNLQASP